MEDFVKRKLRFAGIELSGLSDFINSHFVNSFAKGTNLLNYKLKC